MDELLMIVIAGALGGGVFWLSQRWHEWLNNKKKK